MLPEVKQVSCDHQATSTPPKAWSQWLGRHWRDAVEPLEGALPWCDLDFGSRKLILDSLTLWWTVIAASGNQYSNWQDIEAHQNLVFTTTKQGEALITVFLKLYLLACTCLWSQLTITCDNFNGWTKAWPILRNFTSLSNFNFFSSSPPSYSSSQAQSANVDWSFSSFSFIQSSLWQRF